MQTQQWTPVMPTLGRLRGWDHKCTMRLKNQTHNVTMKHSLKYNARYTPGIMGTRGGDTRLTKAGELEEHFRQKD